MFFERVNQYFLYHWKCEEHIYSTEFKLCKSVYGRIMVSLASLWFSSFMTFHNHWLWILIGQETIIRCRKWNKVNVRTQKYGLNDISHVALELCGSDREKKCPKVSCKHFMALKLNTQKSGNIVVAFSVILCFLYCTESIFNSIKQSLCRRDYFSQAVVFTLTVIRLLREN